MNSLVLLKPDYERIKDEVEFFFNYFNLMYYSLSPRRLSDEMVYKLYEAHIGREYFERNKNYVQSGDVLPYFISGQNAIEKGRAIVNMIRLKHAIDRTRNRIHASDAVDEGLRECNLFL